LPQVNLHPVAHLLKPLHMSAQPASLIWHCAVFRTAPVSNAGPSAQMSHPTFLLQV